MQGTVQRKIEQCGGVGEAEVVVWGCRRDVRRSTSQPTVLSALMDSIAGFKHRHQYDLDAHLSFNFSTLEKMLSIRLAS